LVREGYISVLFLVLNGEGLKEEGRRPFSSHCGL
jgi:hypothetical protein